MIDPEEPGLPLQHEAPPEPPPPEPPAESYPFWGYRDLLALLGIGVLLVLFVGAITGLVYRSSKINAVQAIVGTFALEGLWFAALYVMIRFGYDRPFWRSIGWLRAKSGFCTCVGWGVLAAIITITLGSLLPRPPVQTEMEELLRSRASILLVGFFAITLGPLFEELAFRGFLMPLLVRTFGAVAGVALQAVPFALLHGNEYAWAWQQIVLLFLAGTAFGWMRYKTGSTAASTYMHAGYNLVAFVGIFAQSFYR